ncbi:N-acylneuraminate-9-phosphatase isoform X2 [Gambusia affinis]|uniref:N-acylneuraminate-9-phosphatase isoform X2 n=1 Tax=Gambusia affinis TaxID=33528 RepID=UPI000F36EC37|nr:N-acylneuraminate-9-phosphatase isoform X2 [Gambusia affinis]
MEGKAVKAILFDLDNTLVDTSRAGEVALKKTGELLKSKLNLDDDTIRSICDKFKLKLLCESPDRPPGTSQDDIRMCHWTESIAETTGSSAASDLASQCYYLWKNSRLELLCLTPEVRDLLRQLRGRYKLLLLTNGDARTQREKVEAAECEEFFDAVVIAGDHAEQKPFPSIFQLCFSMLQVEAQDCVMVGDSLDTDIQGGVNAKVRATVWIHRADGSELDGPVKPDYTVPSVLDLPAVLAQLQ